MRNVGPDLDAAISAPQRTVAVRCSCDWDGDGHGPTGSIDDLSDKATTVTVTSVLAGTQPDQANVVEGTAAATISIDLVKGGTEDERLQAVRYFSPFATDSPLAGKPRLNRDLQCDVQFLTASGWRGVPLLRGVSRGLSTSVADRRARLSGLDYRSKLRTPVALPAMAADVPDYGNLFPSKPGLEATWVASYVLWQCGFPVAPPPRAGCRYYAPMHGSAMAFVTKPFQGSPGATRQNIVVGGGSDLPCMFSPGPFLLGTAALEFPYFHWVIDSLGAGPAIVDADGRTAGRIEWWAKSVSTPWDVTSVTLQSSDLSQSVYFRSGIGGTRYMEIANGATTRVVTGSLVHPADGQWHLVGVHWDDAAGTATFRVDGSSETVTFTPTPVTVGAVDDWSASVRTVGPMAELHVTAGIPASEPWLPTIYPSPAIVDRSANQLDGIVPGEAMEGWLILQELAAAEQGAVFCDPDGRPHYAARSRLVSTAAQVPQRTVTATEHMFELAYDYDLVRVFNVITAPYQAVSVQVQAQAWKLSETISLAPGQSLALQASYDGLATGSSQVFGHANSKSDGTGTVYTLGNLILSGPVTADIEYVSDTAAVVTVVNTGLQRVWLVHTDGQPDLAITGDLISQSAGANPAVVSADVASRAAHGDLPLTMPDNRWVQTRSHAWGMAMVTAGDLAQPQAVFTEIPIPGDPRLEYFDRVHAQDPDNTELSADLWVVGLTHQIEAAGGYTTGLAARPARDRFLAGTGTVGVDLVG